MKISSAPARKKDRTACKSLCESVAYLIHHQLKYQVVGNNKNEATVDLERTNELPTEHVLPYGKGPETWWFQNPAKQLDITNIPAKHPNAGMNYPSTVESLPTVSRVVRHFTQCCFILMVKMRQMRTGLWCECLARNKNRLKEGDFSW